MRHNFKELKIWNLAMEIAEEIYKISSNFPAEEKYGIVSQIRRSAVSVPSNIAEGTGRGSDKEFRHFLEVALASAYELETQLILTEKLKFSKEELNTSIHNKLNELEKMIAGFIKKLKIQIEEK